MTEDYAGRKKEYIEALEQEKDPRRQLELIGAMGINASMLGEAIGSEPEEVESILNGREVDLNPYESAIDTLKSVSLFLLKRGTLGPIQVGLWLAEPDIVLGGTPLSALREEGGIDAILAASTTFTRPEPLR